MRYSIVGLHILLEAFSYTKEHAYFLQRDKNVIQYILQCSNINKK